MRGSLSELTCGGRRLRIYTPHGGGREHTAYPVVYANGDGMEDGALPDVFTAFEERCGTGECAPCIYVSVPAESWAAEYSPWPAPPAFRGSPAFEGGAAGYLRFLTETVLPAVDGACRTQRGRAFLMGYSLGGLQALWTAYVCGAFEGVASMSGSLWYDGWTEFAAAHAPVKPSARIYLSLGTAEEKARNPRLRRVGDCTRETFALLQGQLTGPGKVTLEWNPGGHFYGIPERFCAALCWLMRR